jgi:hypothetical protein
VIYDRDINVYSNLTSITVRTSEPDPYGTSSPQGLLNQFRDHWTAFNTHITRDLAHLMTGRNLSGSVIRIALPCSVCQTGIAYALSQSTFSGNYSSRVGLTCHEIGHNYASGHCNSTNPCYIMCSGLGGCSGSVLQFAPVSETNIGNYAASRPCLVEVMAPLSVPFEDTFLEQQLLDAHWTYRTMEDASSQGIHLPSFPYSALLDGKGIATIVGDELWSNEFLLASESGLHLSFYTRTEGVESGESLVVEYLSASGNWNGLTTVIADGLFAEQFAFHEVALPAAAYHDAFRMRFRVNVDETDDDWYIDDIRIQEDLICTTPVPYGTAKLNSEGRLASARWTGSNTLSDNDLKVFISNAIPYQFTLAF